MVTPHDMRLAEICRAGVLLPANFSSLGAARVEMATGGRMSRGRDIAVDIHAGGPIYGGHGGQQGARIGMPGLGDDFGAGADFDDAAKIHDGDTLREIIRERQIMRDKQ